jgi:small subunit ribosomal protein S1
MSESFAELFEESFASQQIKPGAIITGIVVAVNDDVDKREGEISVGDEVEVALDAVEDGFGETKLSREKAIRARTWTELEKAFEAGEVVEGVINGRVKGGFTVEIDNVRAFLPGSLVDVRPVRDPGYLEGKSLEFKVIKLDQRRNNVVVSRRAVVETEYSAEREKLLEELQEGNTVEARQASFRGC